MNNEFLGAALWFVVAWPLLLAIPAVNRRLPWPHHLAIIPAALLMLIPMDASSTLSWLLFDAGLKIDHNSRWLLAMSVAIWLLAATKLRQQASIPYGQNSFYLLTLAGNLGVILAGDMVLFFSFATLMGYSFYGLLIQGGNAAARYYLICLIIADLLLFEALLLFSFNNESLLFASQAEVSPFYLLMVLAGFALKAGLWPTHCWLSASYRSAPPLATLLLALPVTLALLGMLRWLPMSETIYEDSYETSGIVLMVIGITAILYAIRQFIRHPAHNRRFAWSSILASSLITTSLGAGLANPLLWQQHGTLLYPLIALLGISLAGCAYASSSRPRKPIIDSPYTMENGLTRWGNLVQQQVNNALAACDPRAHTAQIKQYRHPANWQGLTRLLVGWRSAITLFVLLVIALVGLAVW